MGSILVSYDRNQKMILCSKMMFIETDTDTVSYETRF